jgi:hypothetical protein
MKTIKIKICKFDPKDKFSYGYFLINILKKYYNVELSEQPDYVFFHESTYDYLNYNCIRIFYTGENFSPNFNLCDYAIGFDFLTFQDRYYRLPIYLINQFYNDQDVKLAQGGDFAKPLNFNQTDLAKKTGFCSFVYGNYMADPSRKEIFEKLSTYKRVDAGGGFLNNIGHRVESKLAFEMQYKFSVAFENSSNSGYVTEKLTNALIAKTIPIYWGSPDVVKEFNPNRFINCNDYKNFDEVLERVKEIDNNDELYLKIINEPVAALGYDFNLVRNNFETFLKNIFDQPLAAAKRRKINPVRAAHLEIGERLVGNYFKRKNFVRSLASKLYKPFKKIAYLEQFKQKMLFKKQYHK